MPYMLCSWRNYTYFARGSVATHRRPHLHLVRTFLEYRRVKGTHARETTDYVTDTPLPDNRIVPDGVFVLENRETDRRGLLFVEMDRGTERITVASSRDNRATIRGKFIQYDRYLTSGRFAQTYASFGEFRFFTLLFVTLTADRVDNIRDAVSDLPQTLHPYYRLTTFDVACNDFVGNVWKSRDPGDKIMYALVQQP